MTNLLLNIRGRVGATVATSSKPAPDNSLIDPAIKNGVAEPSRSNRRAETWVNNKTAAPNTIPTTI